MGSVRWATSLHQDITTRKCYWYTYKHIMCSLLSSIHENNCFLFFKRYHMNIYPSATQKLPPTLRTISRASIARMSKSPRRGHIACEFWKIEDVAFIFSVYFMALWTFAYDHGYRNCDRAGSASTRWVGAVVKIVRSLWNLTGTLAALLPRCLSNFKAMRRFKLSISRLQDEILR